MTELRSRILRRTGVASLAILLLASLPGFCRNEPQPGPAPNPLAALHFRFVGPRGNRLDSVIGEPGNPNVAYVGAADGGIWKTDDGGTNWRPIFDHQDVSPVGALAMAPSEHNVIWAGTGEPWLIRPYWALGDGVYKSTDAGRTWQHMGLDATGHIARIVIDPHDPNRVFVCAIGQAFRPQHERGIFRTLDGGKTWQQVLFVNEGTGCSELAMDPQDPDTLFAGMWPLTIHGWDNDSGGPGGGVYVSHDGGTSWHKVAGHGLPAADQPVGKTAVAIAPSNPDRVYALIQENPPRLYSSDDGGRTWTLVNQSHIPAERGPYYTRFVVSPDNENLLYFVSVAYSLSYDGGKTLLVPPRSGQSEGQASAGGDNHDIWIDPTNPAHILEANDQGVSISVNHGHSFLHEYLPISQAYHVSADSDIPYHVLGNLQDDGSFRIPSRTLSGLEFGAGPGPISLAEITGTAGCEDGFAIPDPKDPDVVWGGCDDGRIYRMDYGNGMSREVTPWPVVGVGWAPRDTKYRWNWDAPIAIDPLDHDRVYFGAQVIFTTTDGGQSWKIISPDLTADDKSHEGNSGGMSVGNAGTFSGDTLFAIAPSPLKEGVIWAGSDDGQVSVTEDGGKHWTNVTRSIHGLPPWGRVEKIEPSHFDPAAAYVAINLQLMGDYKAYVYETSDYGKSWKLISAGVPPSVNSSVKCITEDPVRKGMLYLGTENALYVSWDDGGHWTRLRNNLPPAPVFWTVVQPTFDDLVIATYGRGVWILDDISPLREYDVARSKPVYLFKLRPAYRFRRTNDEREVEPDAHVAGENPPYGADLDFWLKSPPKSLRISILGADGKPIRTLAIPHPRPGLNRAWWDLRYQSGTALQFLTPPPDAPWGDPHRTYSAYGAAMPIAGPIVPPGTYTVELHAGDQTFTRPLQVLPDPHSPGTEQSIADQVHFILAVRDTSSKVADMINHIERTRMQLENLRALLAARRVHDGPVAQAAMRLEEKAVAVEARLVDVHNTGRGEDAFRNPIELYGRLGWLVTQMDGRPGSGSAGGDLGPTEQDVAAFKELQEDLVPAQGQFDQLVGSETAAFNSLLRQYHLTAAIEP
jgi:photosystem II stability/assembly factor-like uncharacterized protein